MEEIWKATPQGLIKYPYLGKKVRVVAKTANLVAIAYGKDHLTLLHVDDFKAHFTQ